MVNAVDYLLSLLLMMTTVEKREGVSNKASQKTCQAKPFYH
jgi:hypothetical protein